MSLENRVQAEPCAGSLSACLVDGNAEQTARERQIKRRALAISISLQTVGLAALVIAPLFAKPTELVVQNAVPIPPYTRIAAQHHTNHQRPDHPATGREHFYQPVRVPTVIGPIVDRGPGPEIEPPTIPGSIELGNNGINVFDSRRPPVIPDPPPVQKKRISIGHIDPAMLTHRVEPVFPALARQIHRGGKVELRAVITTDGSIQSLQAVSGDALFIQSALDAVRQWHYKPTYLNGQPVEIETYITVIYTLQQ